MSGDEALWENTRQWLKLLPESMVPRLFKMIRQHCPSKLPDELIKTVSFATCDLTEFLGIYPLRSISYVVLLFHSAPSSQA